MTFCPDCGRDVEGNFVAHRETEHPPRPIQLTGVGAIRSQEAVHGQPPVGEGARRAVREFGRDLERLADA